MIILKKFSQRKKLFNEIFYEIFNVESNYRTELSVLNLKLAKKIEEFKNNLSNNPILDKLIQSFNSKSNILNSKHQNSTNNLFSNKSVDNLSELKEENILDEFISQGLQQLLTFYKGKHKLISKQVSNLGIILYNFSSQKKSDENDYINFFIKNEKDFDNNYNNLTKAKNKYFDKMNELEMFFHNQENNNINSQDKDKDKNNINGVKKVNTSNKKKSSNKKSDEDIEKEKIDELKQIRGDYKKILEDINNNKKAFNMKIDELSNEIKDFNINENDILYDIFKIFNDNFTTLLNEVNKYYLLFENNKKLIKDLNIELSNNLLLESKINMDYQFEEYNPKFTDINNKKHLSVIQKMNNLIGFEFDKFKSNNNSNNINDDNINNSDNNTDNNALFILLMDKYTNVEYKLNDKEKNLLKGLFNQEKYIKEFLNKLNNVRINKKLFNTKEKFDILIELFNEIYTKVSFGDEKKHELVKFLMILSETFFYKEENEKIFLNSFIKFPPELKDIKFWIKYIEIEIENEIKKYKKNQKNSKYEYIVLLSNTTHLKEYIVEKDKIKEVIDYFQEKYNFSNDDIDTIKNQLKI